jgi:O-antigen/teichoic acid export membrane protein
VQPEQVSSNDTSTANKRIGLGAKANAIQQIAGGISALIGLGLAYQFIPHNELNVVNLIWLFTNFLALLDLGLGRSLSQSIASSIGAGKKNDVPSTFWTAITIIVPLSIIAGSLLIASSGFILRSLNSDFPSDALPVLMLTGAIVPFAMLGIILVGVLQADAMFKPAAMVQIPVQMVTYLGPALVYILGLKSLYAFAILHLITRATSASILFGIANKHYGLLGKYNFDKSRLGMLVKFGGWVAVSSLIGPLLAQFDRLVVLRLLGKESMNLHSALVDAGSRVMVVPISLAVGLFPVVSGLAASNSLIEIRQAAAKSLRMIVLFMVPMVIIGAGLSHEVVRLWLGTRDSVAGANFSLVLIGCLGNGLFWWVPYTIFQGIGKPKTPALVLFGELVVYFPLFAFACKTWGLSGGAAIWCGRAIVEGIAVTIIAKRNQISPLEDARSNLSPVAHAIVAFSVLVPVVASVLNISPPVRISLTVLCLAGFTYAYGWSYIRHRFFPGSNKIQEVAS